ncbi:MAG TPA: hypothetical protein VHB21_07275 [Minicystis sp.]|nr:hypothetical protein [Minicystis sp.]
MHLARLARIVCAGAMAAIGVALSLPSCMPEQPARAPDRCPGTWGYPCLTPRVCVYDAARGCQICRCAPPPFVPFEQDANGRRR